jgi:glycosyltransferase involved in cell wall biosynthesis
VILRPLRLRTGVHTFDRWLYNVAVLLSPPRDADLVVGVDLDGFLWARRRRRPFVVSLKGIIADELKNERGLVRALLTLQARWERRNTERADLVCVTSGYSAAVARQEYAVPADRLAIVPESLDLEAWEPEFERARGRVDGRRRAGPVVLSVAHLYPRKRMSDLLHAALILRARIPDVRIRIVGQGPEQPALRRLHAQLGLGETVVLLGGVSRERLAEEYVGADVFCLPSVQEGFGIVFLEAMAAALPVVACRAAAVPEVVRDWETGLLVPAREPAQLAEALETLLRDPARARRLGEQGRQRVAAYTPERIAQRFLNAVRWSVERARPPLEEH